MNVKQIEERKQELMKQLETLRANINAVNGAIQDCDYWLKQVTEKKAKK